MKVCMRSLVHWWSYLIAGLACGWITELDCWTGLLDIFRLKNRLVLIDLPGNSMAYLSSSFGKVDLLIGS